MVKITYKKEGCTNITDCPYKMQVSTTNYITKVGSQGCDSCTFNEGNNEKELTVDCRFRKGEK